MLARARQPRALQTLRSADSKDVHDARCEPPRLQARRRGAHGGDLCVDRPPRGVLHPVGTHVARLCNQSSPRIEDETRMLVCHTALVGHSDRTALHICAADLCATHGIPHRSQLRAQLRAQLGHSSGTARAQLGHSSLPLHRATFKPCPGGYPLSRYYLNKMNQHSKCATRTMTDVPSGGEPMDWDDVDETDHDDAMMLDRSTDLAYAADHDMEMETMPPLAVAPAPAPAAAAPAAPAAPAAAAPVAPVAPAPAAPAAAAPVAPLVRDGNGTMDENVEDGEDDEDVEDGEDGEDEEDGEL